MIITIADMRKEVMEDLNICYETDIPTDTLDEVLKRIDERICQCECHVDGSNIMEFHPCCELSGQKYMVGESIDNDRLDALIRLHRVKHLMIEE